MCAKEIDVRFVVTDWCLNSMGIRATSSAPRKKKSPIPPLGAGLGPEPLRAARGPDQRITPCAGGGADGGPPAQGPPEAGCPLALEEGLIDWSLVLCQMPTPDPSISSVADTFRNTTLRVPCSL